VWLSQQAMACIRVVLGITIKAQSVPKLGELVDITKITGGVKTQTIGISHHYNIAIQDRRPLISLGATVVWGKQLNVNDFPILW
jgi:hypothetical protein